MSNLIIPPGLGAKMLAADLNAVILDSAVAYVEPGVGGQLLPAGMSLIGH